MENRTGRKVSRKIGRILVVTAVIIGLIASASVTHAVSIIPEGAGAIAPEGSNQELVGSYMSNELIQFLEENFYGESFVAPPDDDAIRQAAPETSRNLLDIRFLEENWYFIDDGEVDEPAIMSSPHVTAMDRADYLKHLNSPASNVASMDRADHLKQLRSSVQTGNDAGYTDDPLAPGLTR